MKSFLHVSDIGDLKKALAVSHSAEPHGPALFDVHYFYGQPTQFESYTRTDLTPVQYGFEVKLDKVPAD